MRQTQRVELQVTYYEADRADASVLADASVRADASVLACVGTMEDQVIDVAVSVLDPTLSAIDVPDPSSISHWEARDAFRTAE